MAKLNGFWSYVHDDDKAEGGRITRLAIDVKEQFEMLTGEEIELFLDRNDIKWGKAWREEIDSNLSSAVFFIPIITPRFFQSPDCRHELQTFAQQAESLGIKELVLSLLYVEVPDFKDEKTEDELIRLIKSLQWEDWTDIRFKEVGSEAYRRGVFKLAKYLFDANRRSEQVIPVKINEHEEVAKGDEDDAPGIIDKLAHSEEELIKLPETIDSMTQDIKLIGQILRGSTTETQQADEQNKGFAARLNIIRGTAKQLSEPTERIWSQSNVYAVQIHDINDGIRILIEKASSEIKENPKAKQNYCYLFNNLRKFNNATIYMIENTNKMISTFEPLGQLSRDLRPVMRRLKQGLTIMIESAEVSREWVELIDETGIICEDTTTPIK